MGNNHPNPPGKNRRSAPICYFLQRDETSCGSCFRKYGPTQQCKQGACQCSRKSWVYIFRLRAPSDLSSWWGGMNRIPTTRDFNCVNLLNHPRNCARCVSTRCSVRSSPLTPNPRATGALTTALSAKVNAVVSSRLARCLAISTSPHRLFNRVLFMLLPTRPHSPPDDLYLIRALLNPHGDSKYLGCCSPLPVVRFT